jgi:hypothetical protein
MKYIFFSIFFLIFTGLIITYINISNVDIKEKKEVQTQKIEKPEENSIVKLLANTKVKNIFPAKELYLKMDLTYIPKPKILYQVIFTKLDKYKLFGIEQILNLNNIKYSIIKSQNNLKLFINFDKKSQAIQIKHLFKEYNFNIELKKVTKIQ